ncbi:response regulator receiver protein [Mycobacterium sherrisii]|uniref:Response regulator receiver protein n=1 Tax=Mycobacterium sherrisii TaxID=243061 RepID=A0A1E3SXL4_9MYCO|nr:GAF and ANTAR domain-containing protein [Mycobacterium sherrisii]ODR06839.1 response regulator receiver protein [Mycobacterium sherrisii]
MPDDNTTVVAQLAELIANLERDGTDTVLGLRELIENGTRHVLGSHCAGITLADAKAVTTVAATHAYATELDRVQHRYREGPCVTAAWEHHTMHVADLGADHRWPRYRQYALDHTPVRSVLSYELFVEGNSTGALNFYGERPHAFTADSVELGGVFATHVALAWSMMRRHDQFRSALASRDLIGQAKGIVMERFNLDAVEAFELLTRLSQQSNVRVADLARSLIDSEHPLKPRP